MGRFSRMQTEEQRYAAQQGSTPAAKRAQADRNYDEMRDVLRSSSDRSARDRALELQAEAYDLRQSAKQEEREAGRKKGWFRR